MYQKRQLDGKNYFAVENFQVMAEWELVNRFAIGTTRVLIKHRLFTKTGLK
jgi:hypothetical protein